MDIAEHGKIGRARDIAAAALPGRSRGCQIRRYSPGAHVQKRISSDWTSGTSIVQRPPRVVKRKSRSAFAGRRGRSPARRTIPPPRPIPSAASTWFQRKWLWSPGSGKSSAVQRPGAIVSIECHPWCRASPHGTDSGQTHTAVVIDDRGMGAVAQQVPIHHRDKADPMAWSQAPDRRNTSVPLRPV